MMNNSINLKFWEIFFLSRKQADYSANSVASEAQIVTEQDTPIRLRKQKNAEVAEQRNRISLGLFFSTAPE